MTLYRQSDSLEKKLGVEVAHDAPQKKPKRPMHVAIVGATGVVGRETLSILAERKFPIASLRPLASERSAGEVISFGGRELTVQKVDADAFKGVDIVFFAAGGGVSK